MKTIEFKDIITLDDNKKYVVASKINYENKDYIYIIDISDYSNIKVAEVKNDGVQIRITIIDYHKQELLNKIIPLFLKESKIFF